MAITQIRVTTDRLVREREMHLSYLAGLKRRVIAGTLPASSCLIREAQFKLRFTEAVLDARALAARPVN